MAGTAGATTMRTGWRDPAPVLRPPSIAILGASPKSPWVPIFQEQLAAFGYKGEVFLVNPSYERIGALACHPSVARCPEVPQHVLVLLPARHVLPALEEAARAGVRSATIYSTGWAEAGQEGQARQDQLRDLITRTGLTICGPNCLGTVSMPEGGIQYPLRVAEWLKPGRLGVVFQSGALLYPFLRASGERGCGVSYVVSCGNEVGLDVGDYLRFLVEDAHTRAIALLLEGVKHPDKFRAALELALDAGKPVVVIKVGRTQRAEQSTLTHTGAMAGSSAVFDALCRRYGALQCDSLDDLIETSRLLCAAKRPAGGRAGMLIFSGSLRSQLLDQAAEQGVAFAEPAPSTVSAIAALAPLDVRIPNPLDCGSLFTDQRAYLEIGRTLLQDPGVDLLLVQEHAPDAKRNRDPSLFRSLAESTGKPVIVLSETAFSITPYAAQFLEDAGVPYMQGIDRGLAAAGHLIAYSAALAQRRPRKSPARSAGVLETGLQGMLQLGPLLRAHGVAVVEHRLARTPAEAVRAASEIGYPVVMKVDSPDISHKSDVGGVRLSLADRAAVERAWDEIHASVARNARAARIEGVLVARMAEPGLEMSVGIQRDPQFGLAIVLSLGGVWIEVLGDFSLRMLPIDERDAREMLGELKGAPLLAGFRGAAPRDTQALVAAMLALSRLALEGGERLESLEINPLVLYEAGRGALAVDARLLAR